MRKPVVVGVFVALAVGGGAVASAFGLATASPGGAKNSAWICPNVASMLSADRQAMQAEVAPSGGDAAAFAADKSRGLSDLDKGLEWAGRGCNPEEDGGTLVPAVYRDALDRFNSGQYTTGSAHP